MGALFAATLLASASLADPVFVRCATTVHNFYQGGKVDNSTSSVERYFRISEREHSIREAVLSEKYWDIDFCTTEYVCTLTDNIYESRKTTYNVMMRDDFVLSFDRKTGDLRGGGTLFIGSNIFQSAGIAGKCENIPDPLKDSRPNQF